MSDLILLPVENPTFLHLKGSRIPGGSGVGYQEREIVFPVKRSALDRQMTDLL
jgi:hypothetical protein